MRCDSGGYIRAGKVEMAARRAAGDRSPLDHQPQRHRGRALERHELGSAAGDGRPFGDRAPEGDLVVDDIRVGVDTDLIDQRRGGRITNCHGRLASQLTVMGHDAERHSSRGREHDVAAVIGDHLGAEPAALVGTGFDIGRVQVDVGAALARPCSLDPQVRVRAILR